VDLSFKLAHEGTQTYSHGMTSGYYTIPLIVNERFPNLAQNAYNDMIADQGVHQWLYYSDPFGMVWFHDDWQQLTLAEAPILTESNDLNVCPNPFNPAVTLRYAGGLIKQATVYDMHGRMVEDLTGKFKNGSVIWNAVGKPSGVYVARFVAGDGRAWQKRITLIK
jgi:hypothetical protein